MNVNIVYKRVVLDVNLADIKEDPLKTEETLRRIAIEKLEIKNKGLQPLVDRFTEGDFFFDGNKWHSKILGDTRLL